jgi:cytoskeleton protein RodZ
MAEKEKRIYPGELLKEARKKKGRKYRKLSSELGIPEKYLEALEENNFSIMAGPTYVRGYLRAYAKKLDLDPELVITAFERYLKDRRKQEKSSLKKDNKKGRKQKFSFLYASILLVIILLIIFVPERNTETSENKGIDTYTEEEIPDFKEILPGLEVEKEVNFEQTSSTIPPNLTISELSTDKEASSAVIEKANDQIIEAINTIEMNFSGDCWIEIMDKNRILEYQLAKAGSSIYVKGVGPFKLIIGNSNRVELFYNGAKISLASTTNVKTNVSCLVLPKGRCSEFTLPN